MLVSRVRIIHAGFVLVEIDFLWCEQGVGQLSGKAPILSVLQTELQNHHLNSAVYPGSVVVWRTIAIRPHQVKLNIRKIVDLPNTVSTIPGYPSVARQLV